MLHVSGECPYCARECGFDVICGNYYSSPKTIKELQQTQYSDPVFGREDPNEMATVYCGGLCAECHKPVMLNLEVESANLVHLRECIKDQEKRYRGNQPKIAFMAPEPRQIWTHPALPPELGRAFADLQRMARSGMSPALILISARTVLEKTCEELGATGKTLFDQIKSLKDQGILTGIMYEWATEIRCWGNSGTHEFKGTAEDADTLVNFTKLLLQYSFELPAKIREMRQKRKDGN